MPWYPLQWIQQVMISTYIGYNKPWYCDVYPIWPCSVFSNYKTSLPTQGNLMNLGFYKLYCKIIFNFLLIVSKWGLRRSICCCSWLGTVWVIQIFYVSNFLKKELYCTVLYCTVLYCTVLYCTVLYCTALNCPVLYCHVMNCTLIHQCVFFKCSAHFKNWRTKWAQNFFPLHYIL